MSEAEEALEDHENAGSQTPPDRFHRVFTRSDVFLHGTYDVGLATPGIF